MGPLVLNNLDSLAWVRPELVLTIGALALIIQDLLLKKSPQRSAILAGTAIGWLALAAWALAATGSETRSLFGGLLQADPLRNFFGWLFLGAAALTIAIAPQSKQLAQIRFGEFVTLLFVLVLGLFLMAGATDLLMAYLSIETVSIVSYVLTGFRRHDKKANEAALKYVIYGGVASGVMVYGISLLYGLFGTTHITGPGGIGMQLAGSGGRIFGDHAYGGLPVAQLALVVAVIFVLAGLGYKIASVPFHMWCPDVYEGAPTPFTAFLSVGPKAAGFALAIRFFFSMFERFQPGLGWSPTTSLPWLHIIGVLSAVTMTLGNLSAIGQTNVKRLLAYSSIAHAGYLLLGLAVATAAGVQSILVYLFVYVVMNVGAFLAVIVVSRHTGGEEITDFQGLSVRAPFAAAALAIFLFSLTGLPPFGGFTGKYLLFAALVSQGGAWNVTLALIGVANSAISLFYYARIVRSMFLEKPLDKSLVPVPVFYTAMLTGLVAIVLATGIFWTPLIDWAAGAFRAI
jgi:NADH-quinone oxidoreductase subunit N